MQLVPRLVNDGFSQDARTVNGARFCRPGQKLLYVRVAMIPRPQDLG